MKRIDIILSILCGTVISLLVKDFLDEWGIQTVFYYLWIIFPFFSLACLWVAYLIGKRFLFIFQGAKHLLVGAFTTVVDLKIFELLIIVISGSLIISKSISFLLSTLVKYAGNKYWAFQKPERENWHLEAVKFLIITLVGLAIDVSFFHYLTNILGAQFAIAPLLWIKLSVVLAAVASAMWNFLGYKLLVFKK